MGPQASARLLGVIVDLATKEFGAKNDSDFPEVILNSIPVPDFISNKNSLKTVRRELTTRVKKLERFNPFCFSIACNTAHILLKDLQATTHVPFVSIIDETANSVANAKFERVGLLGTPVTIKSGLFKTALAARKIELFTLSPTGQIATERVIRNVLAGNLFDKDQRKLLRLSEILKKKGAQGIILGCTELPLIFPKTSEIVTFDTIEILAKALLEKIFRKTNN